jgi:hypothetical protein
VISQVAPDVFKSGVTETYEKFGMFILLVLTKHGSRVVLCE